VSEWQRQNRLLRPFSDLRGLKLLSIEVAGESIYLTNSISGVKLEFSLSLALVFKEGINFSHGISQSSREHRERQLLLTNSYCS
jgi:hypothetical protein